jgi:hypothetical protein
VGAARPLNSWLAVLVEVDGQRKTIPSIDSDIVLTSHAFLAGARASAQLGRFIESAHLSAGSYRAGGDAFGSSSSINYFAIQPGLGLDYVLADRWSARAQLDVRWIRTSQQIRIAASIVYRRR